MSEFSDWSPAPNIRDAPDLYELENTAMDPDGLVLAAMHSLAPWSGRRLVDLGCGDGFWLPGYAERAAAVIGVEPDPVLRERAAARVARLADVEVVAGSAEHLPLADDSVDVIHARFAYFFGVGCEPGLAEAMRALAPGGALVVVDNDYRNGEFAEFLNRGTQSNPALDPQPRDDWWDAMEAQRVEVMSEWRFASHDQLVAVLGNEFRDGAADDWLARHPRRLSLTYGYVLFARRAENLSPPHGRLPQ